MLNTVIKYFYENHKSINLMNAHIAYIHHNTYNHNIYITSHIIHKFPLLMHYIHSPLHHLSLFTFHSNHIYILIHDDHTQIHHLTYQYKTTHYSLFTSIIIIH